MTDKGKLFERIRRRTTGLLNGAGSPKLYPELQLPILSNERTGFFIERPGELPEYMEIGFYKIEVV